MPRDNAGPPMLRRTVAEAIAQADGGPSFTLSLPAVGISAIGLGPFAFATGQWLLTRATAAAVANSMTAPIFEQPES